MKLRKFVLFAILGLSLCSCGNEIIGVDSSQFDDIKNSSNSNNTDACSSLYSYGNKGTPKTLSESGYYYTKDDIALYLVTFKKLPDNYVTKNAIGSSGAGKNERIGGDYFSNYSDDSPTGLCLPNYSNLTECDVNSSGTSGSKRGTHRIVYTMSFKVFYTYDHYDHWQEYLGYDNWGPTFSSGNHIKICQ